MLFWELLGPFGSNWKLFGVFRAILRIAQNCLCYFQKNSEFGRNPEFREQGTALALTQTITDVNGE